MVTTVVGQVTATAHAQFFRVKHTEASHLKLVEASVTPDVVDTYVVHVDVVVGVREREWPMTHDSRESLPRISSDLPKCVLNLGTTHDSRVRESSKQETRWPPVTVQNSTVEVEDLKMATRG